MFCFLPFPFFATPFTSPFDESTCFLASIFYCCWCWAWLGSVEVGYEMYRWAGC